MFEISRVHGIEKEKKMTSKSKLEVRYAETDQMGIVHHSNYPVWYEVGRTDFTREMGMPYDKIEENGVMFPLLGLSCKYIKAAKYGDTVIVETKVTRPNMVKVEFSYKVFRESDGELLNTGSTVHGMVTKALEPLNMKKEKPEIYQLLVSAMETEK